MLQISLIVAGSVDLLRLYKSICLCMPNAAPSRFLDSIHVHMNKLVCQAVYSNMILETFTSFVKSLIKSWAADKSQSNGSYPKKHDSLSTQGRYSSRAPHTLQCGATKTILVIKRHPEFIFITSTLQHSWIRLTLVSCIKMDNHSGRHLGRSEILWGERHYSVRLDVLRCGLDFLSTCFG